MDTIFLIGFMAAGKTAVGQELAAATGLPFVDLDDEIVRSAGSEIAEIFAARSEAGFRQIERDVLNQVIQRTSSEPAIVACGGGTVIDPSNLDAIRSAGLVVELTAPLETTLARIADDGGAAVRPLAANSAEMSKLHQDRQPFYRRAHATVDTSETAAVGVAQRIVGLARVARTLGPDLYTSTLCNLERSIYPIVCRVGAIDSVGAQLSSVLASAPSKPSMVAVVTDENVAPHYLDRLLRSLGQMGLRVVSEVIAAGEAQKTPANHAALAETLVGHGLDRQSLVVALGGGVVGDLTGYVASSLFRGVRVVQVPTTLLAMIDSSIGGKTGVNLASGKNLLGAFWQPELVAIDPAVLVTLPAREWKAGMGEMLKYGLLDSESLYDQIEAYAKNPKDLELAAGVIGRCAAYKSWIVSRDEREQTGERALLNLGHTVGHAIERAAGYGTVLHGEAVALGLIAAARVAAHLGVADPALEERVTTSVASFGLPTNLDDWLRNDVIQHIGVDKKRTGTSITFVTPRGVGDTTLTSLGIDDITKILLPSAAL